MPGSRNDASTKAKAARLFREHAGDYPDPGAPRSTPEPTAHRPGDPLCKTCKTERAVRIELGKLLAMA